MRTANRMPDLRVLPLGRGVSLHWLLHHPRSRRAYLKIFCGIDWAEGHVRHEAPEVERG